MTEPIIAWHFLRSDRRLNYGDERLVVDGETLTMLPDVAFPAPALGRRGMHASVSLVDALKYAPGTVLCRVEVTGDVSVGYDKITGRRRRVLWSLDASAILRRFAFACNNRTVRLHVPALLRQSGLDAVASRLEATPKIVDLSTARAAFGVAFAAFASVPCDSACYYAVVAARNAAGDIGDPSVISYDARFEAVRSAVHARDVAVNRGAERDWQDSWLRKAVITDRMTLMQNDLDQLLERSRGAEVSATEREAQRQSFAYGNTHLSNDSVTRETIAKAAVDLQRVPDGVDTAEYRERETA